MNDSQSPKIQVDDDWKAEAQREKEKLAAQTAPPPPGAAPPETAPPEAAPHTTASPPGSTPGSTPGTSSGAPREMPPATFDTLLAMLATQALLYTGGIPDPQTGQPILHLDMARHHIDLLTTLEEKTKGNLTDDEAKTLATTLYELRSRYVQVANAARAK